MAHSLLFSVLLISDAVIGALFVLAYTAFTKSVINLYHELPNISSKRKAFGKSRFYKSHTFHIYLRDFICMILKAIITIGLIIIFFAIMRYNLYEVIQ